MPYKSRIPQIAVQLESELAQAVNRAGYRIETGAKRRARVDTGYMRGQIRWVPLTKFSGEVIGGANYTIFNEFGTVYMSAQPMFVPATEEVRPIFLGEIRTILQKAAE